MDYRIMYNLHYFTGYFSKHLQSGDDCVAHCEVFFVKKLLVPSVEQSLAKHPYKFVFLKYGPGMQVKQLDSEEHV